MQLALCGGTRGSCVDEEGVALQYPRELQDLCGTTFGLGSLDYCSYSFKIILE
jgi:hypothetical protein